METLTTSNAGITSPSVRQWQDHSAIGSDDVTERRLDALVWAFVVLAIVLRVGRYLLNFPLWHDEIMLARNFLDRDYAGLARPLDLNQVAPVPYLWIQLTLVKCCGFSEWTLRLFALLSSVAGVLLFKRLVSLVLARPAQVLAMGIFAVSYYPIRHAAECKPYASDLTCSLLLIVLAAQWLADSRQRRWLWALVIAGPLAVALSYPTIFVAGGISVALVWQVAQTRDRRDWFVLALYYLAVAATFLALFWLVSSQQYHSSREKMMYHWEGGFPSWRPWAFVQWLVDKHTGELMAYPLGDDHFGSVGSFLCFAVGVTILVRRKQWPTVLWIVSPLVLAMIAAAMRRYPYGGARLAQWYGAPACLAIGLGAATMIAWIARGSLQRRVFGGAVTVLLVLGTLLLARDMSHPYKRVSDYDHRGFARWFWTENERQGSVLCIWNDLGRRFYPVEPAEEYLCHLRIYSAAHRQGECQINPFITPIEQLRCVDFHLAGLHRDEQAFSDWMAEMQTKYELVDRQQHVVTLHGHKGPKRYGEYFVYHFEPKQSFLEASRQLPHSAR